MTDKEIPTRSMAIDILEDLRDHLSELGFKPEGIFETMMGYVDDKYITVLQLKFGEGSQIEITCEDTDRRPC